MAAISGDGFGVVTCLAVALVCATFAGAAYAAPLTITGAGATTVQKLFGNLSATVYKPTQNIIYKALGSAEGRREFIYSVVHFAASDVPFSSVEETQLSGYVKFTMPLVIETISVFTNIPGNPTLRLTGRLLARIFQRKVTTWDNPNILKWNPGFKPPANQLITVVVRKDGSGSTQLFTNYIASVAPRDWKLGVSALPSWPQGVLQGNGTERLIAKMKAAPYSIGYAGTSTGLASGLTEVKVKNRAGKWLTAANADVYAAVPRELPPSTGSWASVSLLNNAGSQSWPITSFAYAFSRQNQVQNGNQGALLVAWLKFLFSQKAQTIASQSNFYALPAGIVSKNLNAIKSTIMSPNAQRISFG